jgi:type I restriction enzyme S subunit
MTSTNIMSLHKEIGFESEICPHFAAESSRTVDLLQERRTALISAAVTGQIDVRSATS